MCEVPYNLLQNRFRLYVHKFLLRPLSFWWDIETNSVTIYCNVELLMAIICPGIDAEKMQKGYIRYIKFQGDMPFDSPTRPPGERSVDSGSTLATLPLPW
jgi:hypothetical protein